MIMGKFMIEENQQVAYLRKEVEKLKDLLAFNKMWTEHEVDYNKRLVERLRRKNKEMADFNALPWWKKMFFRFDV